MNFKYTYLFILLVLSYSAFSQDREKADSLISAYENGSYTLSQELRLLGHISFYHNNPEIKLQYADKLIELASAHGETYRTYVGYFLKGTALKLQGNLDDALSAYFNAINFLDSDQRKHLGRTYTVIADVYGSSQDYNNAIIYFGKGVELLTEAKDTVNLASAILNMGDVYYEADNLDSAQMYFMQSLELFDKLNYTIGSAFATGNQGLVYAKKGQFDSAELFISKAVNQLEEFNYTPAIVDYEIRMAGIYQARGKLEKAKEYALGSYEEALANGLKELIRDASQKLSELYQQEADFERAFYYQSQYIAYRDSINNEETIRRMADLRTEYEVGQKQAEVDLALEQKRNQQILAVLLGVIALLLLSLAVSFYRSNQRKIKTNTVLSEQKEEIEAQRDQLERLNRTKDRFFGIISHDLRGPVNAFHGVSTIMEAYLEEKQFDKMPEILRHMNRSAQQLSSLLDNMLNWALTQQGTFPYNPEKVKVSELYQEVQETFTNMSLAKDIRLETFADDDIDVYADKNSLRAVLRNLVNNSMKFTPKGGKVTLGVTKNGDYGKLSIKDTGIGIPKEKQESLFTLKKDKSTYGTAGEKGTGLGLMLVKEFVELNKGNIVVNSEEGKGTEFIVTIPTQ